MARFAALLELYRNDYDGVRKQLGELEAQRRRLMEDDATWLQRLERESNVDSPLFRAQMHWFVLRVEAERYQIARRVAAVDKAIDEVHVRLVESHRRLRTIERLRERDRERERRRDMRREAAVLDDLGGQRHIARRVS